MTGATNPSVVALSGLYRLVRRTIEAINLVAQSWGRASVGPNDEILISHLGHHANIVP
jgi:selenocysteine lyase/cysteine desulfurase